MQFLPDTLVWVRCDDGLWWPAKVRGADEEMRAFLSDGEDACVEFFHHPGELYPILTTDNNRVHVFHAEPEARTEEETGWFAHREVAAAAAKALRECAQRATRAPPPPRQPTAVSSASAAPFSAAELRNIHSLLGAVRPETAALLRQQLRDASVSVATTDVQREEKQERQSRKRQRTSHAAPVQTPVLQQQREGDDNDGAAPFLSHSSVPAAAAAPPSSSSTPTATPRATGSDDSSDGLPFVPAARRRVIEVLRHEVFENTAKFVLSPVYNLIEVMGAVAVENQSLATTLPSPRALRETPTNGFSHQRRVLLVPLTEDYDHRTGWMVPTEMDGVSLSMSLFVNDTLVAVPPNWQLSPAKEAAAIKTAVSVDITDLVLDDPKDLFSLQVVFSGDVEENEMWRGIIVCVFVEEVGLARLGERIAENYRSPSNARRHRGPVDITEASVKLQCPITTLTMEIPVRGAACEHLQCMELAAVLMQCTRQNVWNCPLCGAAMKPEDICVNHRLAEWISSHPQQLSRVEYVVETATGSPLRVVYREKTNRDDATVEVVDDDDAV